jgi:hypothetical protein
VHRHKLTVIQLLLIPKGETQVALKKTKLFSMMVAAMVQVTKMTN